MLTNDTLSYLCSMSMLSLSETEIPEYLSELNKTVSEIDAILVNIGETYAEAFDAVSFSSLSEDTVAVFEDTSSLISLAPNSRDNMIVMPKVVE